jgi:undecaprenyl-diphosphatase
MFADRLELVATVVAIAWLVLALATAVARRLPAPRRLVRTDVLVAGGVTALLFGAGAALADHVDDAGLGATAYDTAVWAFVLEHRDAAATAVASALRVGGGTVALCALAGAAGLLLLLRGHRLDATLVVSTPFVSTLLTDYLKPEYGRPRPPAEAQLIPETGFSLPSGHTIDATVVLGVLALVLVVRTTSRRRRAAIAAAATVAITAAGAGRVYLGVHWATDVVTGWLLGAAWVALYAVVLLLADARATRPAVEPAPDRTGPLPFTTGHRSGPAGAAHRRPAVPRATAA